MRLNRSIATLGFLLGATGALCGQTLEERGFKPVEQIWGDTDPLAAGLHRVEGGLRDAGGQATYVYRRRAAGPGQREKLYYIAPGVVAEYDRSDYGLFEVKKDEYRILQLIPPNTVFHIGLPPSLPAPVRISPISAERRVVARVDATFTEHVEETPPEGELDRRKWQRYLEQNRRHQRAVLETLGKLDDPAADPAHPAHPAE